MRAMVLTAAGTPLQATELPDPEPWEGQVLLRVRACGVCRTDLHIVDGELAEPKLPEPALTEEKLPGPALTDEKKAGPADTEVRLV